ncbi:Mitogen-activated protein kinase kinase kinase A [Diplonema papillatum]|nr:Mitogen-activated protein kinase kinase kinase A [Diplonema papillatum]
MAACSTGHGPERAGLTGWVRGRDYKRGSKIGQGGYGVVYECINMHPTVIHSKSATPVVLERGSLFAEKIVDIADAENKVVDLCHEIQILSELEHPHIVRYYGSTITGKNKDRIHLFMEYVPGGSLNQLVQQFGLLSELVVQAYTAQILRALEYLHTAGYVHKDLKASNILISTSSVVKITDFGTCHKIAKCSKTNKRASKMHVEDKQTGTPNFFPPERIREKKIGPQTDIWALACVILEMINGRTPFSTASNYVVAQYRVGSGEVPRVPSSASDLLKAFLSRCFLDASKRPSATELLQDPFITTHLVNEEEVVNTSDEEEDPNRAPSIDDFERITIGTTTASPGHTNTTSPITCDPANIDNRNISRVSAASSGYATTTTATFLPTPSSSESTESSGCERPGSGAGQVPDLPSHSSSGHQGRKGRKKRFIKRGQRAPHASPAAAPADPAAAAPAPRRPWSESTRKRLGRGGTFFLGAFFVHLFHLAAVPRCVDSLARAAARRFPFIAAAKPEAGPARLAGGGGVGGAARLLQRVFAPSFFASGPPAADAAGPGPASPSPSAARELGCRVFNCAVGALSVAMIVELVFCLRDCRLSNAKAGCEAGGDGCEALQPAPRFRRKQGAVYPPKAVGLLRVQQYLARVDAARRGPCCFSSWLPGGDDGCRVAERHAG